MVKANYFRKTMDIPFCRDCIFAFRYTLPIVRLLQNTTKQRSISNLISLRPWQNDDLEYFYQIYSRTEVARWVGAQPRRVVANLEEAQTKLASYQKLHNESTYPCGLWAIIPAGSNAPVGTALLLPLKKDGVITDQFEIGWHLHPDWWGKGLATESAKVLLALAKEAGISRVLALCDPDNDKSFAVMQRLQMHDGGITEDWYGLPLRQAIWLEKEESPYKPDL